MKTTTQTAAHSSQHISRNPQLTCFPYAWLQLRHPSHMNGFVTGGCLFTERRQLDENSWIPGRQATGSNALLNAWKHHYTLRVT